MNESKPVRLARLLSQLTALGFSYSEAQRLRRIEGTLSRWSTEECNGTIQRDEKTEKPFRVYENSRAVYGGYGTGSQLETRVAIPDREAGARKQLDAIMEAHPDLWSYNQGDPRGCALYLGRLSDLPKLTIAEVARMHGEQASKTAAGRLRATISQHYHRGTAVCV